MAVKGGRVEAVTYLLDKKANIEAANKVRCIKNFTIEQKHLNLINFHNLLTIFYEEWLDTLACRSCRGSYRSSHPLAGQKG